MDAWVWIVVAAVVAIIILAAVFWSVRRVRQRRDLNDWFPK